MDQPAAGLGAVRTPVGARTPPQFTSRPPPPPPIPDHEILQLIGRGSYGQVWLARNRRGTLRAVKIVSREAFEDRKPFEREFKGIQRFEPVSRAHEGVVDILQVGGTDEYFYYVMELADPVGNPKSETRIPKEARNPNSERPKEHRTPNAESPPTPDGLRGSEFGVPSGFGFRDSEFYTPRTLRAEQQRLGRLPVADCVRLGRLLASALGHLHRHNLVHRDVKPSNIIFVEGAPKLADIGLVADLSEARSFVGTEGFIPPEGPGTLQGDLYSLGKVLYEISTGLDRRDFPALPVAFTAGSAGFQEVPKSTSSSGTRDQESGTRDQESGIRDQESGINAAAFLELNAVIAKACQAEPGQRYPSAEAMEVDLAMLEQGRSVRQKRSRQRGWAVARTAAMVVTFLVVAGTGVHWLSEWLGTGGMTAAAQPASVFVLPFRHSVPGPLRHETYELEQDLCLCGRLTDAFIDGLALVPRIETGPRKSGWIRYDEDELRSALVRTNSTRYILCGGVDHTNNTLKLTLRLHERSAEGPFWTETFSGGTNEVIALERQGITRLAGQLGLAVPDAARALLDRALSNNLAAYQRFMHGRTLYPSGFKPDWRKALAEHNEAVNLDPRYYAAGFAVLFLQNELGSELPPRTWQPDMVGRANRLTALDDTRFQPHLRIAIKRLYYDYDWKGAMPEYRRMITQWPDEHLEWAICYRALGRTNAARFHHEQIKRKTNPDFFEGCFIVLGELVWRHTNEALGAARKFMDRHPDGMVALGNLGAAHLLAQNYPDAIECFRKAGGSAPSPYILGLLGRAYALAGDRANALEMQRQLEPQVRSGDTDPYFLAWIHMGLGEKQAALDCLAQAVMYKSYYLVHADFGGLRTDPAWDDLRDDPRFEAICRSVGMGKDQWPR